jgi:hypothetical protein
LFIDPNLCVAGAMSMILRENGYCMISCSAVTPSTFDVDLIRMPCESGRGHSSPSRLWRPAINGVAVAMILKSFLTADYIDLAKGKFGLKCWGERD